MILCKMGASLYEPINVYKPIAPNIGVVDGPFEYLTVGGARLPLPFSTRMTVVRLSNNASSSIRRSNSKRDWRTSYCGWGRSVISCHLTNFIMHI